VYKPTLFVLIIAVLAGEPALWAADPPVPERTKTAEAPAGLLEALKDKDPSVRLQAAQMLIRMGEAKATLPVVEELLKSPQQAIRLEAGLLLKQIRPTQLKAQLKDLNPSARLEAAQALWLMGGAEAKVAIPVLVELLKSPRHELRFPAAMTLTQRNVPEAKAAVTALVEALSHPLARVRLQAAQRLQQMGVPEVRGAVTVLVDLLREHQKELGIQPAMLLGQMRAADLRAAAPGLREALNDRNPAIRFQAASILVRIGRAETKAAIPVLIDLLSGDRNPSSRAEPSRVPSAPGNNNTSFRLQAMQALAKVGPDAKAAIPPLVKLLDDAQAARVAALALPQLGPDALPPVLETWAKQESFNRPGVIQALGRFGPKAEPAVPKLMEALASPDGRVRELAANALRQIGTEAVPFLEKALARADSHVRQTAAAILADIGPAAKSAIPALTEALQDPDLPVRVQVARALWEVDRDADKVIPILLEALKTNEVILRRASAQLLTAIGQLPEGTVPALRAILNDPEPMVRVDAAVCLCDLPGYRKEAVPVLRSVLKNRALRAQAVDALSKAGPEAKEAVPALLEQLYDDKIDHAFAGRVGSAVGRIAGSEGVEALLRALATAPKRLRPVLVQALAQAGPSGFAAVIKRIDDEDAAVRAVAARSLDQAGRSTAETVSALVKTLQSRDAQVRREALRAMEQVARDAGSVVSVAQAIPVLTDILKGGQAEERVLAAETLAYLRPGSEPAVSVLVETARGDQSGLRRQAIAALGRIAEFRAPRALLSDKAAISTLAEVLDSPDATLRLEAALALAWVGTVKARTEGLTAGHEGSSALPCALPAPLAQQVVSVLLEVVREKNHPLRIRAMGALIWCGSDDEAVFSALMRVLGDDGPARAKAAEVLGRMGPVAKAAVPPLTELTKGPDPDARIQAALALWRIDHRTEAIPVLVRELKSTVARKPGNAMSFGRLAVAASAPTEPPCQQAAEALEEIGPAARAAGPALTKLLRDSHLASCRPYYALALAKIDRQAAGVAVPVLLDMLDGKPDAVPLTEPAAATLRRKTIKALGDLGAPARGAVPSLRKALLDPDERIRSEAAKALKKVGG
jgi:HEAT repeat protein